MKPVFSLAVLATTFVTVVECGDKTIVFAPALMPFTDRHDPSNIQPSTNISLHYASNTTSYSNSNINVTHALKVPSVVLENIASVVSVDCTSDSVAVTFNDSSIFELSQRSWNASEPFIMVTNHLGDCDVELERGIFLATSLSWSNESLVCTASSQAVNVSSAAASTEINFGSLNGTTLTKRDLVLDPNYTLSTALALPSATTLYRYSPYLAVSADSATFASNVTFSGYLKYNWLLFSLEQLYFDLDATYISSLSLSASIDSAYSTSFTYSPSTLLYSVISIPGILELGPELRFSVSANLSASEAVNITTDLGTKLADGNVHLDLLDESNIATSGWTPTYSASANISGNATASFNPTAALTVEMAINFFGGLVDLSTGITANPGFENNFTLTAAEGLDLSRISNLDSNGVCGEGLALESDFTFTVGAFVTEWWSKEVYSVELPILDECYSWES